MALIKKTVSDARASFLAWLCCLPCRSVAAFVCLLGRQQGQAEQCACGPYADDTLESMAETITSHAISYTKQAPHEKILALRTEQWDTTKLFDTVGILNPLHQEIYHQIKSSVLNILDTYNFGFIKSQELTPDELKVIGKKLKESIFLRLPAKEDFENLLKAEPADAATSDIDKRNRCLVNRIKEIANNDFIHGQLNFISNDIEKCRRDHTSVTALLKRRQVMAAATHVLGHDAPPVRQQLQR
jgi:hypothetical protein